jgi:DNA-binding MarR family transcriptional regulator
VSAEPAGNDELAERAWHLMTQLFAERKSHFPEIAARFGLNPGAMHALLSIDPDAPQSMSALAGAWRCDASNVTWLVDRLEEHGLAERRPHPGDRRVRTVALTRKGHRLRGQIETEIFAMPNALRRLSPRDLDMLCRILAKTDCTDA